MCIRDSPIIIGMFEAQSIAMEIEKIIPNRPMTHDLFKSLSKKFTDNVSSSEDKIQGVDENIDLDSLISNLPKTEDLLDDSNQAPVIRLINAILSEAIKDGASDIHIEPYEETLAIRFRIDGILKEKLKDLTFQISANSFFQTNSHMAEKLYEVILDSAKLKGDEVVYDLYCGAGSISLFLAQKAKFVYGFDIIVSSIENAEQNAIINKIENIDFNVANLDSYFQKHKSNKYPNPPIVFLLVIRNS